jgi:hypothetical protein
VSCSFDLENCQIETVGPNEPCMLVVDDPRSEPALQFETHQFDVPEGVREGHVTVPIACVKVYLQSFL